MSLVPADDRGRAALTITIPGGRRFAAVLKSIWYLSANDNPYADWILIRVTQRLSEIRAQMSRTIEAREAELERLRSRGLSLSVLASSRPVTVELGFRSPEKEKKIFKPTQLSLPRIAVPYITRLIAIDKTQH